jgi:hypothetical protein
VARITRELVSLLLMPHGASVFRLCRPPTAD